MTLLPGCNVIEPEFQLVVPVAVPLPPAALLHVTCVTPTLSLAVPLNVTVAAPVEYVDDDVGEVIETVGRVVSLYVTVNVAAWVLFAASRAVIVMTFVPVCS